MFEIWYVSFHFQIQSLFLVNVAGTLFGDASDAHLAQHHPSGSTLTAMGAMGTRSICLMQGMPASPWPAETEGRNLKALEKQIDTNWKRRWAEQCQICFGFFGYFDECFCVSLMRSDFLFSCLLAISVTLLSALYFPGSQEAWNKFWISCAAEMDWPASIWAFRGLKYWMLR